MLSDTWISGIVIHGNGFGRTLGFPTANVELEEKSQRPRDGIYACWVNIGNETWKGALHAGPRPAIGETTPTVEVHILDFDGRDLYGEKISLQIVQRLRHVKNFESIEQLQKAIANDCENARRYFAAV